MASTGKIILEFLNDLGEFTDVSVGAFIRRLELDKSRKAIWSALERLENKGEIERKKRKKQILLCLTQRGKEKINKSGLRLRRKSRNWDGGWYLVSFDIPETHKTSRNLFRKELLALGFGKLQRSLWISPYYDCTKEVQKIIDYHHLKKYVEVFHSRLLSSKSSSSFASQVWDLEGLNKKYSQFIRSYRPLLFKFREGPGKSNDLGLFKLKRVMSAELSIILLSDPQLPDKLLPPGFRGAKACRLLEECVKLFRQYSNKLSRH